MSSHIVTVFTSLFFIFPFLASAIAIEARGGGGRGSTGQCNTGPVQCCQSVQSASSATANNLTGFLGLSLGNITGLIGLSCNPISTAGLGGDSCSSQPVCCTETQFGGLISLGCTPVNINL